ncbi:MAG: glycosyl hydrolase family 28-related protein, partial [Alphaproteobacteria bacterium]
MSEHITIGDVSPRALYIANGTQRVFTFAFPIFNDRDLEIRINGLIQTTGFSITGAGESAGGLVTFTEAPPNGARIMLRRRVTLSRMTDFQENSLLRASALNDELDFQMAALQQVASDLSQAIRTDPADDGNMLLPLRAARGNRLLGFDSLGDIAIFDRDGPEITLPYPGAIPRSVEDKLNERLSVRDFGALGDGIADDGPALQAAMNAAVVSGRFLEIGEGTYRTGQPLLLGGGAAGLMMRGSLLYAGPSGQTALTIGDGGTTRNATKLYMGIRLIRASISDWENEADIGLVLRNFDSCQVEIRQIEGFTIGIRTLGEERGFEDTTLTLGRIVNNRIGLDVRTASASAWNTSV